VAKVVMLAKKVFVAVVTGVESKEIEN